MKTVQFDLKILYTKLPKSNEFHGVLYGKIMPRIRSMYRIGYLIVSVSVVLKNKIKSKNEKKFIKAFYKNSPLQSTLSLNL